jgi:hypothetical protein
MSIHLVKTNFVDLFDSNKDKLIKINQSNQKDQVSDLYKLLKVDPHWKILEWRAYQKMYIVHVEAILPLL